MTQIIDHKIDAAACQLVEALGRCTPMQRLALLRSEIRGVEGPWFDAYRDIIVPRMEENVPEGDIGMAELRAAADELPVDVMEAYNTFVFCVAMGNIFDVPWKRLDGGGIEFRFEPRILRFLEYVEGERPRIDFGSGSPTALEVGCWQGTMACELMQRGMHVTAMDINEMMRDVVSERVSWLKPEHQDNYRGFISGAAHEALRRLGESTFDIITCQETLEHIPSRFLPQTCDEMIRVAEYSVLVEVPGWDDNWPLHLRIFTLDELRDLFHADENEVEVLQAPGGGVYTTICVRVDRKGNG